LENFELQIGDCSSILLIGKNGAGKTTAGVALEVLQKIARGVNRVDDLVKPRDMTRGHYEIPVRFELKVKLKDNIFDYSIAFELPEEFKELRVLEEKLSVNGKPIFTREQAQVHLATANQEAEAKFRLDWHLAALPIIEGRTENDPLSVFKLWLARLLILRPIPNLIDGDSEEVTLQPNVRVTNFGAWFSGLIASAPSAYGTMDRYLRQVMPDFNDIKNPTVGKNARSLEVHFSNNSESVTIPFTDISDGEKCFMICAMVLAANASYGPLVCFWDEPDNHLAMSEVGHFVMTLRKAFQSGGQFIMTSHNPEAIRRFSGDNTLLIYRNSHLEPAQIQRVSEINVNGDLVNALIQGDLEP
jgi:predicted ATPase